MAIWSLLLRVFSGGGRAASPTAVRERLAGRDLLTGFGGHLGVPWSVLEAVAGHGAPSRVA